MQGRRWHGDRVAFIGLGNMGGGMAANLAKAGHEVRAFDLSEDALLRAEARGASRAASAEEAVADAEAVVTMLPAGKHVRAVYETSVIGKAPASAILMDCSTIDVATARDVIGQAEAAGYQMVDAPVSGGIAAAEGGTLTFMVGGTDEAFARAEPFLAPDGQGGDPCRRGGLRPGGEDLQQHAARRDRWSRTCEAFAMAKKLGLDLQTFYDISSKASGQSWSMTSYCPVPGVGPETPADRDYEGGFAAALMLKDLRLAMEAAQSVDAYTPMGAEAEELYTRFAEALGGGHKDFSGIIKMIDDSWTPPA